MKRRHTVLVVEEDAEIRDYFRTALECQGYRVEVAQDPEQALTRLGSPLDSEVSVVLLDLLTPRKEGWDVLERIRAEFPGVPILALSEPASAADAVEAVRRGARELLAKSVSHEELDQAIRQALEVPDAEPTEQPWAEAGGEAPGYFRVGGLDHRGMLVRVAASDVPVLLQGETGVGKEVLARQLHALSPRAHRPFVKVNCAALPSELIESELFGYQRGAFTGAFRDKPGKFEIADGGTLLLDEIADMEPRLQAKLLHVLQDGEIEPLGGREPIRVNVRVMAATHRDLATAVEQGVFRADLYHRINVISLRIPPLRERREEILPLAEFLLRKHAPDRRLSLPEVLKPALLSYDWPGNVRELENVMRRYLVLQDPETLARELLRNKEARALSAPGPQRVGSVGRPATVLEKVEQAGRDQEREAILAALAAARWNRKQAAQMLNLGYKALLYRMRKLHLDARAERASACGQPRFLQVVRGA